MLKPLHLFFATLIYLNITSISADTQLPFADSHIHYNWDQAEIVSAQSVVQILKQKKVGLALVSSTPSHLALELRKTGGDWIIPFFSPYIHELGKRDWYLNPEVVKKASDGLEQGHYAGIGEIHFSSSFPPRPNNKIFLQLMALAKHYRVPALIHVDAANERYFAGICKVHSEVNIIFAHAGGNLEPRHVRAVLNQCPNVWVDFAARDDWRYGGLTDDQGRLKNGWKQLVMEFPERFITGTDPVWRVTRTQSWDQADDGWDYYGQLYRYHQTWLANLPRAVQRKIAWDNVLQLIRR